LKNNKNTQTCSCEIDAILRDTDLSCAKHFFIAFLTSFLLLSVLRGHSVFSSKLDLQAVTYVRPNTNMTIYVIKHCIGCRTTQHHLLANNYFHTNAHLQTSFNEKYHIS